MILRSLLSVLQTMDSLLFEISLNLGPPCESWRENRSRRGRRWIRPHSSSAFIHSSLSSPSKTLILTLFVSLSSPTDSLGLLLPLSGSPVSASSLCSLGGWSELTLVSAVRGGGSFQAPSRELDAPVPSMASRSGRCSGSSTLMSLACSSWLARLILSVASDLGSSFRLLLEFVLNPFTTALRVVFRVPNSCPNGTATQTLGGKTKPLKHLPGKANSSGDDWRVNIWRMRLLSPRALGRSTRMSMSEARSPSDAQHELFVPSALSCRTVLHLSTPEGVPMYAWPSNDLQPR